MRGIAVLGSTGSVGRSALEVVADHPGRFEVIGLSANRSWRRLAEQAKIFRPRYCFLADPAAIQDLRAELREIPVQVLDAAEGLAAVVADDAVHTVLLGISGSAGLPAALAVLENRRSLAIANKESLVMAGELLSRQTRDGLGSMIPVDSEHSAIFQAIRSGEPRELRKVVLTASGGPFRLTPRKAIAAVTPQEALRHPVWSMGSKISIDSATMMNKALEIIEAKWLFGLEASQIEVAVHPQSIVHSMVEFQDGAVIAQMGVPDMKIPIQYALSYPHRLPRKEPGFNFRDFASLTFEEPDHEKFPALRLGYRAVETGGTMGAVLNAANEVAVERFLAGTISFPEISSVVEDVMDIHDHRPVRSVEDVIEADRWARDEAQRRC